MSERLVASRTCTKVVVGGEVEFRKGRPLKRRDVALLGSKLADCEAQGLLIPFSQYQQLQRAPMQPMRSLMEGCSVDGLGGLGVGITI